MLKNSFIYTSQFSVFIHTQINKRLKLKYCYAKNATSFPGPFPGLGAGRSQGKGPWKEVANNDNSIQTAVIQTTLIKMHANFRF